MRNKRYVIFFLFFASIIMLAVPIIPHHHHANGIICMKNDVTPENQCPHHQHHPGNDSCCDSECMARINSAVPTVQADYGPQYMLIATLFDDIITEYLLKPQERRLKYNHVYLESLHGTNITRAFSLRGPPCLYVA